MISSRRQFLGTVVGLLLLEDRVETPTTEQTDFAHKVQEGYQSIATRALELLGSIRALTIPQPYEQVMRNFSTSLKGMKDTGAPTGTEPFYRTVTELIAHNIKVKPNNAQEALQFAFDSLRTSTTLDAFLKAHDVTVTQDTQAAVRFETQEHGNVTRQLSLHYDPKTAAQSAIETVHELIHITQTDHRKKHELLSGDQHIKGYQTLWNSINSEPELKKRKEDINRKHHGLYTYFDSAIIAHATKIGVPITPFQTYAQTHIATVNYLLSTLEGEAMLLQAELFSTHPHLDPKQRHLYELAGICLALAATQSNTRPTYYKTGLGVSRYFKDHTEEKAKALTSPPYQKTFSHTFFPNP